MPSACLTPEVVDSICPPLRGEAWIADNHLKHFGVRAWAGKRGGGKAYAIRLRDQFGFLVRESFRPNRDCPYYHWEQAWDQPLSYFLDAAREWARDRIASHLGNLTAADRRERVWQRRKARVLATTIDDAITKRLTKLRHRAGDHPYLFNIEALVRDHIPPDILQSPFRTVPVRRLADAISHRAISYGNVKVLRAFIGAVFKTASAEFGPLHWKLESIQRRCSRNLDARKAPPFPEILLIEEQDYLRLFAALESDDRWRQALAIDPYFATEAKLQQVLRARWSDIIDATWFPFVPAERKLWYESRQRLGTDAQRILKLIEEHHRAERIASPYLFPSPSDPLKPIATIQRSWARYCDTFGWQKLPMSHVVLRHRRRANPSYSLFFYRYYLNSAKATKGVEAVSKVVKRRENLSINAMAYA